MLQRALFKKSENPWTGRKYLQIISDKDLICRIYKKLLQLNNRDKQPSLKKDKGLHRQFSKESIPMAKKHMKRGVTLLVIMELHIKATVKCHFIPARMAII